MDTNMTTTERNQVLDRAKKILGDWYASDNNPSGVIVDYDDEQFPHTPWRIYDDHVSERFATADRFLVEVQAWRDAFDADAAFERASAEKRAFENDPANWDSV